MLVIPTLIVVTIVSFILIQLPPGDYLTSYIADLAASGDTVDQAEIATLEKRYGLDQPIYVQYGKWIWGVLNGDFGVSFEWNLPVRDLIGESIALTAVISLATTLFTWVVGVPIGIYSATHQYSVADYCATIVGFLGSGIPNFMIALVLMWLAFS